MFEFLFNYPQRVFDKGKFVLMGAWPAWVLVALCLAAAVALAWPLVRGRSDKAVRVRGWRLAVLWALQAITAVLLLTILWQPALLVATLQAQQNVVAVVVDDSASMALKDGGTESRSGQARGLLNSGLLDQLRKQFQVRLYRTGTGLERLEKVDALKAGERATRLSDSLKTVAAESSSVPIGAIVLLSDGADNSGGIDLATLAEIRSRRIPVHTVGFGREKYDRDIEIAAVDVPARALAEARVAAQVTVRQTGYSGQKAAITIRDEGRVLAQHPVTFRADGTPQTETVLFGAGAAGPKALTVSVTPLQGEENAQNNALTRLVTVEKRKPRILYIEGEPKWEYKFIRRAMDEEKTVAMSSMLRTTQNKIYRQGIAEPKELEDGFPAKAEDLFAYDGIILGGVEVGYFSATQQDNLRMFVDRRGGGLLFLGGRNALADGGWAKSPLMDLLPVSLVDRRDTFQRSRAKVNMTNTGRDSLIARLEENPDRNFERWGKMPDLENYQTTGAPKAGAVTLLEFTPVGPNAVKWPLLVTQNYGRGRTALFATSGSWRWQMLQPLEDLTHEMFWQQLGRWLVTDAPARVAGTTPRQVLADEQRVTLRAEVRDKVYLPVNDATVVARIMAPDGKGAEVELRPDPFTTGVYTGAWDAEKTGSYVAEIIAKRGDEELGTDIVNFRREDGTAENFGTEQNRELLEKLSGQTGGQYYQPADAGRLAKDISYSEAGITVREAKDLWNMPIVFLALLGLKAIEWMLRRQWGVV